MPRRYATGITRNCDGISCRLVKLLPGLVFAAIFARSYFLQQPSARFFFFCNKQRLGLIACRDYRHNIIECVFLHLNTQFPKLRSHYMLPPHTLSPSTVPKVLLSILCSSILSVCSHHLFLTPSISRVVVCLHPLPATTLSTPRK